MVHQVCAPHARRKRKAARERFAKADDVRNHFTSFAREPAARTAKASINFIENQQCSELVADATQHRKKFMTGSIDAAADLNRFHQDGSDFFCLKKFSNLFFHGGKLLARRTRSEEHTSELQSRF